MVKPDADLSHLRGRSILIAESNPLIALDLAATVAACGLKPVMYFDLLAGGKPAPIPPVVAALVDLDQSFDEHDGLIDGLQRSGTPTVLTTAWAKDSLVERFPGFTVLEKPIDFSALVDWFAAIE